MFPIILQLLNLYKNAKKFISEQVTQNGLRRRKNAERILLQKPLPSEIKAFELLQALFRYPSPLVKFDANEQLCIDIDASKEFGFAGVVYYPTKTNKSINEVETPSPKKMKPILFISRAVTVAERNYWATEM